MYRIAFVVTFVLAVGAPQASAASAHCPDTTSHSGGSYYAVKSLEVTHTTCAVGEKLARAIPAYRVPKPVRVQGFRCTSTVHYANPGAPPIYGGVEDYVCHKRSKLVTWKLEFPSEI